MELSLTLILAAAFGLAFGSFATVLESRIPNGPAIWAGSSACPNCSKPIKWRHNIPVLSYLVLRGRCAQCKSKIAFKYPLIEIGTASLFVAIVLVSGLSIQSLAMAAFAVVTFPLLLIDLRLQRLPNKLTYSLMVVAAAIGVVQAVTIGNWGHFWAALMSGLIPFVAFFLLALLSRGGMGLGDVKLAGGMGFTLGLVSWQTSFGAFVIAFLLGGCAAILLLVLRKAGRKHMIPFGPYLLLGAWISYLGGPTLQSALLSLWLRQ
ncbi:MAG: prepilin peptidase [Micrococcales bacterium]